MSAAAMKKRLEVLADDTRRSTPREFLLLLGLSLACGCGPSGDSSVHESSASAPVVASRGEASPFRFDETKQVIYLDTRIAPGHLRRFDIGLGSITLQTLHVTDKALTFRYTTESEGGYTIYECRVPVSATPVEFKISPDGTPGATSFDLADCKLIRSGNVLLD